MIYTSIVRNADPVFFNTDANNFNIETETSGAEDIGLGGIAPLRDLNGTLRNTNNPDAGAYESVVFPDDED